MGQAKIKRASGQQTGTTVVEVSDERLLLAYETAKAKMKGWNPFSNEMFCATLAVEGVGGALKKLVAAYGFDALETAAMRKVLEHVKAGG